MGSDRATDGGMFDAPSLPVGDAAAPGDGGARSARDMLRRRLDDRSARVGVIGIGYVGLPLSVAAARAGFRVTGFDTDAAKPRNVHAADSYVGSVDAAALADLVARRRLRATCDFARLARCDVVAICVPTPLGDGRAPDLRYVRATVETIARHLRPGQLIALESTTYPGTTRELVKPLLEAGGLVSGRDFFLGFSPEREDPGRAGESIAEIPKLVGGDGSDALAELISDGRDGLLFAPGDPDGLAPAIAGLFDHAALAALAARLSENGRARARIQSDGTAAAEALVDIYAAAIGELR